MGKKVTIAKGVKESKKEVAAAKNKAGGSNVGKYAKVAKEDFAGPAGGSPQGSYPINTKQRAKAALKLAHNAPKPSGIKKKIYSKYPSLKKK